MSWLKILLWPLSLVYGAVTLIRNQLYDWGFFKSIEFDVPVIGVGNLRVGGTGKTPMIEYLVKLLGPDYQLATLSRGYGRKTSGYILVSPDHQATEVGDEPLQFVRKFGPNTSVHVGENRVLAIPEILVQYPQTQVILLDDAFQHRAVKPALNLLLTEFSRPFVSDFLLPWGFLRESRNGAGRAQAVIVTKCPAQLNNSLKVDLESKIRAYIPPEVPVFFAAIGYGEPIQFGGDQHPPSRFLLVTGIARSQPLLAHLANTSDVVGHVEFGDHKDYHSRDIEMLVHKARTYDPAVSILTTEKDMVKLSSTSFDELWEGIPRFYLPIKTQLLGGEENFKNLILTTVKGNS